MMKPWMKEAMAYAVVIFAFALAAAMITGCTGAAGAQSNGSGTQSTTTGAQTGTQAQTPATGTEATPLSPKEKWGIDELIIVLMPGEDNPNVVETRNVFDTALSEKIGIPVKEYRATDYSAMVEAMRTGYAHVGQFGPFAYIHASERAGAEALAAVERNGLYGYYSLLVTHVDSGIMSLDDLKGRTFGFVDPESASGNIVPSNEILTHFGSEYPDLTFDDLHINGKFFSSVTMTGNHQNSLQGVYRQDIDAAGISSNTLVNEVRNGNVEEDKIRVIHTSPLIPSSPFAAQGDLPQELKDLIKEFFIEWDDEEYWEARSPGGRYVEVLHEEYDYVRELRDKYDLSD